MKSKRSKTPNKSEAAMRELYEDLLRSWNQADAHSYAGHFLVDGIAIGFDGSQHIGRSGIEEEIGEIFKEHQTGRFVAKVREARQLTDEVGILRAIAGVVPAGDQELKPETNMIQTVVAVREEDDWRIAVLQTTPAKFHGRPELARKLTDELRKLV